MAKAETVAVRRAETAQPAARPERRETARAVPGVALLGLGDIDPGLRREWRELGAASENPNPFFLHWFLEPALARLDPGHRVRLLTVRDGAGALIALMPLTFEIGYAKLPLRHACLWSHRHCYNGAPLIARGAEDATVAALLAWLDTRPEGARFLRFPNLPVDEHPATRLREGAEAARRDWRIQYRHERAILAAGLEPNAMLEAAFSGKKRKELRRLASRFADLGEPLFTDLALDTPGSTAIDAFLAMENAGWKGDDPQGFPLAASEAESGFFRRAMQGGAREGAVLCTALTLDGKPTAMLFSLGAGGRLSAFKTSYDESLAAYSPGLRLIVEASRRMLEDDEDEAYAVFDSCARPGHPVVDRLWPGRTAIAQINVPAAGPADRWLLRLAETLERLKMRAVRAFRRSPQKGRPTP